MSPARVILLTLLSLLLSGCSDSGYEKRNGQWHYDDQPLRRVLQPDQFTPLKGPFARDAQVGYYRGSPIDESDGPTFEPLDDHYARDKSNAYFCDTYRKGQEYYTTKHIRIIVMEGVSPGSLRLIKDGYARDNTKLFYEGAHVPVKDLDSFEILDTDFQRDRVTAYYVRRPIPGSDGSTFAVIGMGYSKDKNGVYFSAYDRDADGSPYKTIRVTGALSDSFSTKGAGYAVDARQVYHNGKFLSKDVANFQWLASLYAKTSSAVYFDGKPVAGADAATFTVLESREENADAKDAKASYLRGERAKVAP